MTTYLRCFGSVPVDKRGFDEECLNCSTKLLCEPLNLPVVEECKNEWNYYNGDLCEKGLEQ